MYFNSPQGVFPNTGGLDKRIFLYSIIVGLILIGGSLTWYIFLPKQIENIYLIPGVPYVGLYTGTRLWNSAETSVYTVLQYWGDKRFSTADVAETFSLQARDSKRLGLEELAGFFGSHGYLVRYVELNELFDFAQYINPRNRVPLVVHQMASRNDQDITVIRVVIGIDDKNRLVTVHDNIFGSTYKISYDEFLGLFPESNRGFLVITPSPTIAELLQPQLNPSPYLPRTSIMDNTSVRQLIFAWLRMDEKTIQGVPDSEILLGWLKISKDEAFPLLHPTARIIIYNRIARYYTLLHQYDEAINMLKNFSLPLYQEDIGASFNGWERSEYDPAITARFRSIPWDYLGKAYIGKGNILEAKSAFKEALRIDPTNPTAKDELTKLK